MEDVYRLDTRDRPGLLFAMMQAFVADDCRISFEGRLSQTELVQLPGVTHDEDAILKRATLQPKLDFLVLPLTSESLPTITKAITSKIAFGERGIIHVRIVRAGKIAFAAYDGFDRESVVAYSAVSTSLLDQLTETRILRAYKRVAQENH
jgi:hypothetical protein